MSNDEIQEIQLVDEEQPVDEIQEIHLVDEEQPVDEIQEIQQIDEIQEIQLVDEEQPVDEIPPASNIMHMDGWVVEIKDKLNKLEIINPPDPHPPLAEWPSIFGNWNCWDDFEVSFLSETKKWQSVSFFRLWFGLNVRSFLEDIHKKEDLVWSYYRGVHEQFRASNSKRFIEHLLGISCFLIFAMIIFKDEGGRLWSILLGPQDQSDRRKQFYNLLNLIKKSEPMLVERYLFTMDYQIPWFIVEAVYTKHSNLSTDVGTPIIELALSCFDNVYPVVHPSLRDSRNVPQGGFKHLLHIFHWSRTTHGKFILTRPKSWPLKKMDSFYIPSATELQLSEIVFEKHADSSIDVEYSDTGVMKLAPWHLLPYSIELYRSLLRFEWDYCDGELPFTAYVACMVCLLQTEEDVKLLRANGIVPSTTNDEKDVLRGVQEFKNLLRNDIRVTDDLNNLSVMVTKRHARKYIRFYGEFKSRYCRSPWKTISLIIGILLFVLTLIGTILSFLHKK